MGSSTSCDRTLRRYDPFRWDSVPARCYSPWCRLQARKRPTSLSHSEVSMPLVSTSSIVLSALRYSETSKIVRLATREHGVQSAIAKGALRPKSRFGAALQLLSEGQAQVLMKEHRELHVLTAFDLRRLHVGLATDLERYASACALANIFARRGIPESA